MPRAVVKPMMSRDGVTSNAGLKRRTYLVAAPGGVSAGSAGAASSEVLTATMHEGGDDRRN